MRGIGREASTCLERLTHEKRELLAESLDEEKVATKSRAGSAISIIGEEANVTLENTKDNDGNGSSIFLNDSPDFTGGDSEVDVDPDDDDWGLPTTDESGIRLDAVAGQGSRFLYRYDFGDNWRHDVEVEKVLPADEAVTVPACVDGRRACPPEDCGGTGGFERLLEILDDPSHPEHRERREWMGRDYDPTSFDPGEFDENLRNDDAHLVNARLGIFGGDRQWEATLWARNLLDEETFVIGFDVPVMSGYAAINAPPRTYGLTLNYRFE